jgi:hypothetical protein
MVVGKSEAASFLSRVVNLDGTLYSIEVSEDGSEIAYAPYAGEAGTLDLREGFKGHGKLEAAIVTNGEISFDLADAKRGLTVPAGAYTLAWGLVSKGSERAQIRTGKMQPVHVAPEKEVVLEWGGPLTAEFTYTKKGDTLTISPTDLFFYGSAGEEYFAWVPDGQPPKFIVKDAKTGREISTARFGGC